MFQYHKRRCKSPPAVLFRRSVVHALCISLTGGADVDGASQIRVTPRFNDESGSVMLQMEKSEKLSGRSIKEGDLVESFVGNLLGYGPGIRPNRTEDNVPSVVVEHR